MKGKKRQGWQLRNVSWGGLSYRLGFLVLVFVMFKIGQRGSVWFFILGFGLLYLIARSLIERPRSWR